MKRYVKLLISLLIIIMLSIILIPNKANSASTYYQYVKSGISAFPASYQEKLRQLANEYPNWKFQAYYTGISWDDLIAKERDETVHRNRVTVNAPSSWKHCGFVDDGWACASDAAVKYYLDPRNFLNSTQIFQFVETSYNPNVQTLSAIQNSVKGTFLDNTITCKDLNNKMVTMSYSQMIIEAAKQTNISAFYIKSKIIQEVGSNGSESVTGRYPGYEGYYNFYNYGAYDEGDDIANGLKYAKNKGWDSPYKAIVGGAELIGTYYINYGQNTPYFNKWDVVGTRILKEGESQTVSSSDMFWHQYMTNIQDPNSQSYSYKKLYSNSLQSQITFIIPVYDNMPASNIMPLDVPVTGLSFNKDIFIVNIDETDDIIKNVTPSNASNKDVNWAVSDSEVVRIYNGHFRGLKEGVTTVTGTTIDGGYTATCTIYVRDPNKHYVESIDIEKDLYIINEDEAVDISFSYSPLDSANAEFDWIASDPEIVRVWGPRFRGLKEGVAEVIAKTLDGTVETRTRVAVRDPNKTYVNSMKIEKSQYNIATNEAVDINFSYSPNNADNAEFEWTSSDPEVLRVWGPRFRGLKAGTAEIIGRTKDGTVETRAKVTIKDQKVENIVSVNETYIVDINGTDTVEIAFNPSNASNQILYWKVSDSEVVRVYNGFFRGLKEGTSTITAISEDGGYTATCTVIVRDPNKTYINEINLPYKEYNAYLDEAVDIDFTYAPSNAANTEFEWTSSNPDVLRVWGPRFRALKVGTAEVIARTKDGMVEARIKVVVTDEKVQSISSVQNTYTVNVNETGDVKISFNPSNASNKTLYWKVGDSEIVRVYNGHFRGLKEGRTTITAISEDGGYTATCEVIVNDPNKVAMKSINLPYNNYNAYLDEAVDIDFTYSPSNATNTEIEWTSSNPDILRVWGPRFRALEVGTAEVIARTKDGTVEAKIKVIVTDEKVQSISSAQSTYTVNVNETGDVKINFNPSNASNKILYWEVADPEIVRVYNGHFRGLKQGKTTITAISEDGGKRATCEIIVK